MGPYKCPDCGAWWSGLSHVCATSHPATTSSEGPSINFSTETRAVLTVPLTVEEFADWIAWTREKGFVNWTDALKNIVLEAMHT